MTMTRARKVLAEYFSLYSRKTHVLRLIYVRKCLKSRKSVANRANKPHKASQDSLYATMLKVEKVIPRITIWR